MTDGYRPIDTELRAAGARPAPGGVAFAYDPIAAAYGETPR